MTDEFLEFSKKMGNDLSPPIPEYNFHGLKSGDKWCLCVLRWREDFDNKVSPKVILENCHQKCLDHVSIDDLKKTMPNKYQDKPKLIKVFYDGDCHLCRREVKFYQKLDKTSKFDWIDINQNKDILNKYGLNYIDTQKIFHVIDKKEHVKKGVDGFLVIWRELKYWRILYFVVKLPIINQVADIFYNYFAKWRFKKKCNC